MVGDSKRVSAEQKLEHRYAPAIREGHVQSPGATSNLLGLREQEHDLAKEWPLVS
jgi:hypothetical protein